MAKIRLRTANSIEVRRTLSRVMNMVVNGEIDSKAGNTIILGCNAIMNAIRTYDQQKRIDELERILEDLNEKNK